MKLPRLYPILDAALLEARQCTLEIAAAAILEAGAEILQIRRKGHWTRADVDEAARVALLCGRTGAMFVINDRADMARLLGAGLHVGQDDIPPAEARRLLGPASVLGYSTHNALQLQAADGEPADYLALGPVFPTQSKMNPDPVVGIAGLRAWRALTALPLVAIGGVTRSNALSVLDAGADSVAVIGDLLPAQCSAQTIRERFEDWRRTMGAHG
jgi:thiamine-phosphate pyrophosphorylase